MSIVYDIMRRRCVWSSSPKWDDFREWGKKVSSERHLCMPVWSCDELEDCARKCGLEVSDEQVRQNWYHIGGVPRYALRAGEGLRRADESLSCADDVTKSLTQAAFSGPTQVAVKKMKDLDQSLFHMSCSEQLVYDVAVVASQYVFERLMELYPLVCETHLLRYLQNPSEQPGLYEKYCNHIVRHGGEFTCKTGGTVVLEPCTNVVTFDRDHPPQPVPNTLYIPDCGQFPCVDAYTSQYMFQYTTGLRHSAKVSDSRFKVVRAHFGTKPTIIYCVPESRLASFRPPSPKGIGAVVIGIRTVEPHSASQRKRGPISGTDTGSRKTRRR